MNAMSQVSAMPCNIEAEQQLLGAVLTQNGLIDRVSDILRPEHFFDPVHARIFTICQQRIGAGMLASPVVLRSIMGADEGLS